MQQQQPRAIVQQVQVQQSSRQHSTPRIKGIAQTTRIYNLGNIIRIEQELAKLEDSYETTSSDEPSDTAEFLFPS